MDLLDRIADKFTVGDDCWEWTAGGNGAGYGHLSVEGRMCRAHRVVYELLVGPIPEGLSLDHLCRNKRCVRPDHLEPVTHQTNVLRGDGPTAVNAQKMSCAQGHEFTDANTYIYEYESGKTRRECRMCATVRRNRYLEKQHAGTE